MEIRLTGSFPNHPFDSILIPRVAPNQKGMISEGGRWLKMWKDTQFYYWIQNEEGRISEEEEGWPQVHQWVRRALCATCRQWRRSRASRWLRLAMVLSELAPWFLPNLEPLHWIKWSLLSSLILPFFVKEFNFAYKGSPGVKLAFLVLFIFGLSQV